MFALIDCTNYKAIATHESYKALAALAFIQYANIDSVIFSCAENRPWAQFNDAQLNSIFDGVVDSATSAFKTGSYTDNIHRCREIVTSAPHLRLPISEHNLLQQAEKVPNDCTTPFKITAGVSPQKVDRWHVEPQRNRSRYAKPEAVQLTRSYNVNHADSTVDTTGTSGAPATPKVPKAPRVARAKGSNRPAPGSTTGKVWDMADECAKEPGVVIQSKEFRKTVIGKCKDAGINPSTCSVQFGVWLAACSK